MSLRSEFPVVMFVTISTSLPLVVCRRLISCLRYLCLFTHCCVQHILCCVFTLFFFIWCIICCQFLWTVPFGLPLQCCLTFIYLVYHILPVSLDCPFLIAPSVLSNVYLSCVPYVASFSGSSIFDYPFSVL